MKDKAFLENYEELLLNTIESIVRLRIKVNSDEFDIQENYDIPKGKDDFPIGIITSILGNQSYFIQLLQEIIDIIDNDNDYLLEQIDSHEFGNIRMSD